MTFSILLLNHFPRTRKKQPNIRTAKALNQNVKVRNIFSQKVQSYLFAKRLLQLQWAATKKIIFFVGIAKAKKKKKMADIFNKPCRGRRWRLLSTSQSPFWDGITNLDPLFLKVPSCVNQNDKNDDILSNLTSFLFLY